jgi:hypothetical protein
MRRPRFIIPVSPINAASLSLIAGYIFLREAEAQPHDSIREARV